MKIKEFASRQKVSYNALYKAIRREGYSAKELTDKRGNITAAGLRILRGMYSENVEELPPDAEQRKETEAGQELKKEIESLREQLAEAKGQLAQAVEKLTEARGQLAEARERAEKWERLYIELQEKASQERAANDQQLKAAHVLLSQQLEAFTQKANPIKRLFSGRKKSQEIEE